MVEAADKCADVTWDAGFPRATPDMIDPAENKIGFTRFDIDPDDLQPGDINCRYSAETEASVNYYTCKKLAIYYGITIEEFFKLNPEIAKDCSNILPNSEYCVDGCKQQSDNVILQIEKY